MGNKPSIINASRFCVDPLRHVYALEKGGEWD